MPPNRLHRDSALAPFFAVTLGIALFSVMDALMKSASIAVGAYNAMLWRSLIGTALMFPLWKWRGGKWPDRAAMRLHMLRGAISGAMATSFFWGLVRVPMAEGIALSFIAPLIALYLAAAVLGEEVGKRAVWASVLGLAGVLVIAAGRLGEGTFSNDAAWGIASILASAVLYAFNLILQRKQAQIAGPIEVALFHGLTVTARRTDRRRSAPIAPERASEVRASALRACPLSDRRQAFRAAFGAV